MEFLQHYFCSWLFSSLMTPTHEILWFKRLHFPVMYVLKTCSLQLRRYLLLVCVLCSALAVLFGFNSTVYTSLVIFLQCWGRQGSERGDLRGYCDKSENSSMKWDCTNRQLVIAKLFTVCTLNTKIFSLYIILAFRRRVCPVWTLLGNYFFHCAQITEPLTLPVQHF